MTVVSKEYRRHFVIRKVQNRSVKRKKQSYNMNLDLLIMYYLKQSITEKFKQQFLKIKKLK